jgi:hypothetical protein
MVSAIQMQSSDITKLMAQTAELAQASAKQMMPQPMDPLSRLASLAQGFQASAPVAPVQDATSPLPSNLVATVQNLQLQVKDLSTKLASVLLERGSYCVRFGNTGVRNPPMSCLLSKIR